MARHVCIRYIQGLRGNSRHLSSTSDSASLRSSGQTANVRAPQAEEWFGLDALKAVTGGGGRAGTAVASQKEKDKAVMDALWALRDVMNRDSTRLATYLDNYP